MIVNHQAALAFGARLRQRESVVKRAESAERELLLPHQPAPGIVEFERALLALVDRVLAGRHAANPAGDLDRIASPIGGPVRADVACVVQPFRASQTRQADRV